MRVKCVMCDEIGQLPDEAPLAKKLKKPSYPHVYVPNCTDRIVTKDTWLELLLGILFLDAVHTQSKKNFKIKYFI